MNTIKINAGKTLMVAHRGVSGLERENTVAAFLAAGNRSYYGMETDIYRTNDGNFILNHDGNLQRIAGENLRVEEASYETLRRITLYDMNGKKDRVDLHLASLEEYVSICVRYEKVGVLELKSAFTDEEIAEIIRRIESFDYLSGITFISFNYDNLLKVRAIRPEAVCQFLTGDVSDEMIARLVGDKLDIDAYHEPLTEERFIKNGCTLLDGIALYQLPDGSFCHIQGGASNENANMQVFFALTALQSGNAPYLFAEPDVSFAAPQVHRMDYRIIVTAAVLLALGIACIALFLRKKRNLKHFLPPCLLAAVLLALVWFVRIERAADYYQPQPAASGEIIGSVSLSIRCDTVAGKAAYIPENGEILGTIEIPITDDTTVFDALTSAVRAHGIRMEYSGTPELAYVKGIADLYEFDHGELSGWVFHVNGESASVGCGEYLLADGDAVEWLYSLDLGKDVAE